MLNTVIEKRLGCTFLPINILYIIKKYYIFQNPRKRKSSEFSEEDTNRTASSKVAEHLLTLQTQAISQDLPGAQHHHAINNVAVDVEVHYNDNSINNNTERTIALDMAKITAGAPGIKI